MMKWSASILYLICSVCLTGVSWSADPESRAEQRPETEPNPAAEAVKATLEAKFEVTTSWDGGLQGTLTLTNVGKEALLGWSIEFDYPLEITSLWNGILAENNPEAPYRVIPKRWNGRIDAGSKIQIGFNACPGDVEAVLTLISLNGVKLSTPMPVSPPPKPEAEHEPDPTSTTEVDLV